MMIERLPRLPRGTEEQRRIVRAEMDIIKLMQRLITCDAKTRQGTPCRRRPVPGKKRCRCHGGLSRGATSEAGRQRIAEASRERMIAYWKEKKANAKAQ